MTYPTTALSIPGGGSATLTLPEPMTPAALSHFEAALGSYLRTLRRDLVGADADADTGAADPGAIEYASWAIRQH